MMRDAGWTMPDVYPNSGMPIGNCSSSRLPRVTGFDPVSGILYLASGISK